MSVVIRPSSTLSFNRPLLVESNKRSVTIHNTNEQPVAFKVKTTAPRVYCVRPNSGRIEPGQSVEVAVTLQGLKEEPPMGVKCKDKFLIQSTVLTPEKETLALPALWNPEGAITEDRRVYQQKLKVVYLPADGQNIAEEDEGGAGGWLTDAENAVDAHAHAANGIVHHHHHHDGEVAANGVAPHGPAVNGEGKRGSDPSDEPDGEPQADPTAEQPLTESLPADRSAEAATAAALHDEETPTIRPTTPSSAVPDAPHDEQGIDLLDLGQRGVGQAAASPALEDTPHPAAPASASAPAVESSPLPASIPLPGPAPEPAAEEAAPPVVVTRPDPELLAKYNAALAENQRLRALLATAPDPTSPASTLGTELRRRPNRALSDDGSTVVGSEADEMYDRMVLQPEGVPLQVVIIIALGVFITTYLFF